MKQPPGYAVPGLEHLVCLLKKPIYGLKQSGRQWYKMLCAIFLALGFTRSLADPGVFIKQLAGIIAIVAAAVDDLTISTNSLALMAEVKAGLCKHFEMTDLGELHWILGIEVQRDRRGRRIMLSQRAYIDTMLSRFNLDDAKPITTPMAPGGVLSKHQCPTSQREFEDMRDIPYREAVGALNYAAVGSRPDIAYAVSTLAQFSQNPGRAHWEATKHVLRYLKGSREYWLTYGKTHDGIVGYSDANWGGQEHKNSIIGYVYLVDGGAISWASRKQSAVAQSTTESEYIAMAEAAKEALWLRNLVSEILSAFEHPTLIYADNKGAILLALETVYHSRTKHIDLRYHFIRHHIEQRDLRVEYCPTDNMAADVFTKALARPKLQWMRSLLGLQEV